jgi:SpoIID/LytB domain protein
MEEPEINIAILQDGGFNYTNDRVLLSGHCNITIENGFLKLTNDEKVYTIKEDIVFIPEDFYTDSFVIKDVVVGKNFHWEHKEDQRFRGILKLFSINNEIIAVNMIPTEEYLMSVISSEMSAASSQEFLKAHAVISRSWLFAQIEKKKQDVSSKKDNGNEVQFEDEIIRWRDRSEHELFDVCADDHCQRYQGLTKVSNENAQKAVMQTRGIVLEFEGSVCDARYSKCCGGISEYYENVWEPVKHPYLSSIVDYKFEPDEFEKNISTEENAKRWIMNDPKSFCNTFNPKILSQVLQEYDQATSDFYRWKVEYTQSEIEKIIKQNSGIDFGEIINLIPSERGSSGRLIKLQIEGTKKSLIIGKELEIRKWLSVSHLYSSAFIVERKNFENGVPQNFILYGAGWGHGVGLCQLGAAVMSEMGYYFDEILFHYFKGVTINKLYS